VSYILDALKRSEEERRQDQMPSFAAQPGLMHVRTRKTPLWPYVLIAVLLFNALVYAWINRESWMDDSDIARTKAGDTVVDQGTVQTANPAVSTTSDINRQTDNSSTAQEAATVSSTVLAETLDVVKDQVPQLPSSQTMDEPSIRRQQAHEQKEQVSQISVNTAVEGQPSAEKQQLDVQEGTLIRPKSQLGKPLPESVTEKPSTPTVVVASQPLPDDPAAGVSENREQMAYRDVPLLSEMSVSFQRSVPDLVFNSHIYSDIESARRVMINNIYLSEGQELSGLKVLYIGELEIVFQKNNRQFKLPVMRDWYGS